MCTFLRRCGWEAYVYDPKARAGDAFCVSSPWESLSFLPAMAQLFKADVCFALMVIFFMAVCGMPFTLPSTLYCYDLVLAHCFYGRRRRNIVRCTQFKNIPSNFVESSCNYFADRLAHFPPLRNATLCGSRRTTSTTCREHRS